MSESDFNSLGDLIEDYAAPDASSLIQYEDPQDDLGDLISTHQTGRPNRGSLTLGLGMFFICGLILLQQLLNDGVEVMLQFWLMTALLIIAMIRGGYIIGEAVRDWNKGRITIGVYQRGITRTAEHHTTVIGWNEFTEVWGLLVPFPMEWYLDFATARDPSGSCFGMLAAGGVILVLLIVLIILLPILMPSEPVLPSISCLLPGCGFIIIFFVWLFSSLRLQRAVPGVVEGTTTEALHLMRTTDLRVKRYIFYVNDQKAFNIDTSYYKDTHNGTFASLLDKIAQEYDFEMTFTTDEYDIPD